MKILPIVILLGLSMVGCKNFQSTSSSPSDVELEIPSLDSKTNDAEPNLVPTKSHIYSNGTKASDTLHEKSMSLPGTEVFKFSGDEPAWYTIDDDVMGGISNSNVEIINPGLLFFSGTMSLENNGGFSSVRSDWQPTNLELYDGVLLRVLGDGKNYRLRIRSAQTGSEISYNAVFETTPGKWQDVYIPFEKMVPTYRGFIMNVGKLDPSTIGSFGFMLSDKQAGEFELMIDWIRAIAEDELPTS
jgi:monofunctional biosynthetic peptidoglycan transglycosylase